MYSISSGVSTYTLIHTNTSQSLEVKNAPQMAIVYKGHSF